MRESAKTGRHDAREHGDESRQKQNEAKTTVGPRVPELEFRNERKEKQKKKERKERKEKQKK